MPCLCSRLISRSEGEEEEEVVVVVRKAASACLRLDPINC